MLYAHISDVVGQELEIGTVARVLNVGAGFARVDGLLAVRYPVVHFTGIDRSILTQLYNTAHFGDRPNMTFCTGSALELLAARSWAKGLLLTARTLTKVPTSFVRALYGAAAAA